MPARASLWAGGACVAALSFGSLLAVDEMRRGPDETLDASGLPVVAPEVSRTAGRALFRPTPIAAVDQAVEARARAAQQHYLSGVIFFQKGELDKARGEWELSLRFDSGNAEARAGLDKLAARLGGAQ